MVTQRDKYFKLRAPAPTPDDELCRCVDAPPIKLMSALGLNPIHCLNCNGEVLPETFDLAPDLIEKIAQWNSLADALYRLWLDSGEYEEWAKAQLSNVAGSVNSLGRETQSELNKVRRCYYWWFQDETDEDYEPISNCPVCGDPLLEYTGWRHVQLICERCSIVTPGA